MKESLSTTEENYLKAIYSLSVTGSGKASNNELAGVLKLNPPTVLEMLRRMQRKKLISYDKKTGVLLSKKGKQKAIETIRKHRLWEVFLHEKLGFRWDEIHNIAEQLEHIQSEELVKRLDEFLDFPKFDPHGDPIPQANGKLNPIEGFPLSKGKLKTELIVVGVKNNQDSFLKFLNSAKIKLGSKIKIISIEDFDQSLQVILDQKINMNLSKKVSDNILVRLN